MSDEAPSRIWSEPLTDSERHIIDATVKALAGTDPAAAKWFNFLIRVYNARSAVLTQQEALREAAEAHVELSA